MSQTNPSEQTLTNLTLEATYALLKAISANASDPSPIRYGANVVPGTVASHAAQALRDMLNSPLGEIIRSRTSAESMAAAQ